MVYKNISSSTKIFYGVTFKPGDIREVPGYVNDRHMIIATLPSNNKQESKVVKQQPKKSLENDDKVIEKESTNNKEEQNNG